MGQCVTCKHWRMSPKMIAPRRGTCDRIGDTPARTKAWTPGGCLVTEATFGCVLYEIQPALGPPVCGD